MKTHDMLADAFLQEGVDTCFALLGDANMAWCGAMAERGCEFVYVRHEHCAAAAAMAWARKRESVGVVSVTCGPGLTQLMTALPAAVRASIPLVVFAGESPLKANWYNQHIEQRPFVEACGAAYHALHHPARMLQQVRDAFLQARREQRPVVLGVPFDLQNVDWPFDSGLPEPARQLHRAAAMAPAADDIERASRLVRQSQRIVVLAGLGARHAVSECRELARRCDALLATTLPARGLFYDDSFNLSIAGGFSSEHTREVLGRADLIIAIGARLAQHTVDTGKLFPHADVIHIDREPASISQGRLVAQTLVRSDAALGAQALCDVLSPPHACDPDWRCADMAARIRSTVADSTQFDLTDDRLDPRAVVRALDEAIPDDWELVNSSGHCSYFFAQMPHRPFRHFLTIREYGAIGNGTSFAMGVAQASQQSPVVLFDGDGSLLMHVQEIDTMIRHRMNILICVLNDGAYGSEVHKLRAEGHSLDGTVFGHGNLARIAQGFGGDGEVVTRLAQIPSLVDRFSEQGGVFVVDVHVSDQVYSPVIGRAHYGK